MNAYPNIPRHFSKQLAATAAFVHRQASYESIPQYTPTFLLTVAGDHSVRSPPSFVRKYTLIYPDVFPNSWRRVYGSLAAKLDGCKYYRPRRLSKSVAGKCTVSSRPKSETHTYLLILYYFTGCSVDCLAVSLAVDYRLKYET